MRDRQTNETVVIRLDIERNTRMFRIVLGLRRPGPCENQATWRSALDDFADNVDLARIVEPLVLPFGTTGRLLSLGWRPYVGISLILSGAFPEGTSTNL